MGRRTKATDLRVATILDALRAGNTRRAAAAYGQVSHETFYRWLRDDVTFSDAVEKAEADAEVRALAVIIRAAQGGTWQAAAWWAERRRPSDYALHQKVEMSGKDGGPIEHRDISTLPDHERQALAEAIRGHLRGDAEPEGSAQATSDS